MRPSSLSLSSAPKAGDAGELDPAASGQRNLRGGEDGARGQRSLTPTGIALIELARPDGAVVNSTARRADEPVRPSPDRNYRATSILGAVEGRKAGL